MWAIEYVQVPLAKEPSEDSSPAAAAIKGRTTGSGSESLPVVAAVPLLIESLSNCSLVVSEDEEDKASLPDGEEVDGEEEADESPSKVRMAVQVVSQQQQKRPSLVSAKSLHEQINNIVASKKGKMRVFLYTLPTFSAH